MQLIRLVEKARAREADLAPRLVALVERDDALVEADEDVIVLVVGLDQELLGFLDLPFLDERCRCLVRVGVSQALRNPAEGPEQVGLGLR